MARARRTARSRRTSRRPGPLRGVAQLLAVVVGGVAMGGLLVLTAIPDASGPVPPQALVGLAGAVAVATVVVSRRLGRVPQTSGRRAQGRGRR